jgi:hypothetical protein
MKYDIVKSESYLLICDDSDIKVGDYIYDLDLQKIVIANDLKVITSKSTNCWYYKKIIAHRLLNGAPYLDGVDVLPSLPQEDDVEELATSFIKKNLNKSSQSAGVLVGFIEGYNKAREKYKFTEKDLIKAIAFGFGVCKKENRAPFDLEQIEFIQSLQQTKLPIAFEREVEPEYKYIDSASGDRIKNYFQNKNAGKPKTITNSEERAEWVGNYIFE